MMSVRQINFDRIRVAYFLGMERNDDEDWHEVTLSRGFWLGETTVRQALWQAVMGDNPSGFKGDNRPVEQVSWNDVQSFIGKLSGLHPDLQVRLPYEAEWEYACRAGTLTPLHFGDADKLTPARVNYRGIWEYKADTWGEGAKQQTAEVKSYPCNPWGLYEMHGNVWEWCEDVWRDHLGTKPVRDPLPVKSHEAGALRVVRGGSWNFYGRDVRSAFRYGLRPDFRCGHLGFRLALGHAELGSGQVIKTTSPVSVPGPDSRVAEQRQAGPGTETGGPRRKV